MLTTLVQISSNGAYMEVSEPSGVAQRAAGGAGCPLARYERRDSQLPGSAVFLRKRLNY
jgi:hypothetical protein